MKTEMMEALSELDSIIELLEAKIPANPESPQNQKLRKRLQKELGNYFKRLEQAFPFDDLERLYLKYVKQD